MQRLRKPDMVIGLALALTTLLFYLRTLSPAVGVMDGGELATVASTLGIAHPTGYPLFTLLGWVFTHLPLGGRTIVKLNRMAAILCSTAIFFFYHLFVFLLSHTAAKAPAAPRGQGRPAFPEARVTSSVRIASATGVLLLAFSPTYWSQALSLEVYPLHLVLLSIVMTLFLRSVVTQVQGPLSAPPRSWPLFAYALGLGFTNHMSMILLAPATLYLFFATHGFGAQAWKRVAQAGLFFLMGLSVYLYLPLRAAQHPLLIWGNPVTSAAFWGHVSGAQYRYEMFTSGALAVTHLKHFVSSLPGEFQYPALLFALAGLWALFRHSFRIALFTALLFGTCVLYAINYAIPDISSYFLLALITVAVWCACGIRALLEHPLVRPRLWLGGIACLALVPFAAASHYRAADESRNYAIEDYVRNMMRSLDSRAVIISLESEVFSSPSYYYQFVEGLRPDVVVVDDNLLDSPWYYTQLEQQYPWLVRPSKAAIDAFVRESEESKRARKEAFDPKAFVARRNEMIHSIVQNCLETRPVYVTSEVRLDDFRTVPYGLAFRVIPGSQTMTVPLMTFDYRPIWKKGDPFVGQIETYYATAYTNQGLFRIAMGDTATGVACLRHSLTVVPGFPEALTWLDRLEKSPTRDTATGSRP